MADIQDFEQRKPQSLVVRLPGLWLYFYSITNGDEMVKQLLMEFIGVCISNVKGWRMKKALFLVGQGDTGKSQLKSLVERLLGGETL